MPRKINPDKLTAERRVNLLYDWLDAQPIGKEFTSAEVARRAYQTRDKRLASYASANLSKLSKEGGPFKAMGKVQRKGEGFGKTNYRPFILYRKVKNSIPRPTHMRIRNKISPGHKRVRKNHRELPTLTEGYEQIKAAPVVSHETKAETALATPMIVGVADRLIDMGIAYDLGEHILPDLLVLAYEISKLRR